MIITRKGWVVVMLAQPDPKRLHYYGGLFGPVTSAEVGGLSENLSSNGLEPFGVKTPALEASSERRKGYRREGYRVCVADIELRIAETYKDWEDLRGFGSYIAALGSNPHRIELYGTAWAGREKVLVSHDSWAPFYQNGFRPFTDLGVMVGEKGLGVLSELARQAMERVRLVGLRLKLPKER
ncbi:MAG: hypothetical protein A3F53_00610 [Candidatus Zambryskibacteria bacterium RIFCSPHIGHO2_12_FULL_48_10]|nr:MAG: hypothetical protein A3F53_00610 [Candidatus Zambryskibacteria bacterium RIFCSPHIGHO2_12_FULL_48_10]